MVSTRSPGMLLARYIYIYVFSRDLCFFPAVYLTAVTAMVAMVEVRVDGGYGGDGSGGDG